MRVSGRKDILLSVLLALLTNLAAAQNTTAPESSVAPAVVEVSPAEVTADVGQKLNFTAVGKDASGQVLSDKPSFWFAAPFDLAAAEKGVVTVYEPGEVRVGAVIGGKTGYAKITVRPAPAANIEIARPFALVPGATEVLQGSARNAKGDPVENVHITWKSDTPAIVRVDQAGIVTALKPGQARVRAIAGNASGTATITVLRNLASKVTVLPETSVVKTGDVIHFKAMKLGGGTIENSYVAWSIVRDGAVIYSDGAFVAEQPGTYIVKGTLGTQEASGSVVALPRNAERGLKILAHVEPKDTQSAEQWIIGNYAYLSSVADKVWVYDISDPSAPKLIDTVTVDARLVNDVSTTPDGKIGVITREGASTRKNGIVFLDTSDPAHVKVLSEYTATVTGGVHSAYLNTHYAYITDDATGSLRIIDFGNPKAPKEVARWQVETPLARTIEGPFGPMSGGRYLHDVQVKDGLAYLAYWRDGLVILDVGNGIKHGSPEHPQLVSQLRFNHNELYGNGWLAGTHAVFRYKNYVFVGDEVFPAEFDLHAHTRIPVRGIVHVVDVSDIQHPRKVAEYAVPEAGAHNIWVDDDILYMGFYNGGGRILDVSGELRGDLYRQGREIARLWTGDPNGYRPNLPLTWGAQPQNGLVFFNDINSGLWIVKLEQPKFKGSTTAPPLP